MIRLLRFLPIAAIATLAILAAGCKGPGGTSTAPGGFPPVNPGGDRAQWVGIGDLGTNCASNNTTTSQIENWSLGSNAVPLTGNLTPNDRYGNNATTKVDSPYGWFVDNNGNEWIANFGNGAGTNASVIETSINKNGTGAPSKTITSASFIGPSAVYVSQVNGVNQWVYVADNEASEIFVFPATASGLTAPTYTITDTGATPLLFPIDMKLDQNGNIWVTNSGHDNVLEFSNPTSGSPGTYNENPTEVIGGGSTTLGQETGLYLDARSNIWVSDYTNNAIDEFPASSDAGAVTSAPNLRIVGGSTGLSEPFGVAVDNGGNVYSVSRNPANPQIEIWTANSIEPGTNNTAPTYTIAGPNTNLVCPVSIQVYSISGTNDV